MTVESQDENIKEHINVCLAKPSSVFFHSDVTITRDLLPIRDRLS